MKRLASPAIVARRLSAWFARAARPLPWRTARTPYRVWVSEVMLQQTRVETVLRYHDAFLARFPDVWTLARAREADVLAAWSGLGYYRRARALHAGAREIVERFGGVVPATSAELRSVRGIGDYTAGAILSIAYDRPAAAVDGNVARVLSRLDLSEVPPSTAQGKRALATRAEALSAAGRPSVVNEALIELGALICTPRSPRCDECPLARVCLARSEGRTDELPVRVTRRLATPLHLATLIARRGDEVLVGRRRTGGLYGGLWEPPMAEGESALTARRALAKLGRGEPITRLRHLLTHRELSVEVFAGDVLDEPTYPEGYDTFCWVREAELGRDGAHGASTLAKKVLRAAPAERR